MSEQSEDCDVCGVNPQDAPHNDSYHAVERERQRLEARPTFEDELDPFIEEMKQNPEWRAAFDAEESHDVPFAERLEKLPPEEDAQDV